MQYRSLTEEELRDLRPGEPVNVRLLGGEVVTRLFDSFAPGGTFGDTFARYRNGTEEGLRAIDPMRLVTAVTKD